MEGLRVWDKFEKKMYYDEFFIGTDGELYRLLSYNNIDEEKYIVNLLPAKISRYIVMQRSKIKDRCGIPIYELDIIQDQEGTKYKVRYSDEAGFYGLNENNERCNLNTLEKYECVGSDYEEISVH